MEIKIYGHRGAAGLSPESTLASYETALRLGVDMLDMDVALTKDNVVVVSHTPHLCQYLTRNAHGQWLSEDGPSIHDLSFDELQQYDVGRINPNSVYAQLFPTQIPVDGQKIPSLQQVIEHTKKIADSKVGFQIEVKSNPHQPEWSAPPEKLVPAIIKVLRDCGVAERSELHSFDWRNILLCKELAPEVTPSFISEQQAHNDNITQNSEHEVSWTVGHDVKNYNNSVPHMVKSLGGKIWCPRHVDITHDLVKTAHQEGLKVIVWTADTVEHIRRLIDCHVDGIITNRPDVLRGVLAAKRFKLPEIYFHEA